jgi:hypothetical protein
LEGRRFGGVPSIVSCLSSTFQLRGQAIITLNTKGSVGAPSHSGAAVLCFLFCFESVFVFVSVLLIKLDASARSKPKTSKTISAHCDSVTLDSDKRPEDNAC